MSLFKNMLVKNHLVGMAIVASALFTPAIASAATAYISCPSGDLILESGFYIASYVTDDSFVT